MGRRRPCLLPLWLAVALLLIIISTAHDTRGHAEAAAAVAQAWGSSSMMRTSVGSRPPSCAGRCWWCGGRRCVAVQVPITPQQDKMIVHGGGRTRGGGGGGGASSTSALQRRRRPEVSAVSSYDDHSNYKPLSWRCKCGGLNP